MTILSKRSAWVCALAPIMVALLLFGGIAGAQQPQASDDPVASAGQALDQVEAKLKHEGLSTVELIELGRAVAPIRDQLLDRIAELEPQVAQAETRLKQLGPAPAADAPPEPEALAIERARLAAEFSRLDATLKQARLLAVRADQLAQTISDQRYSVYARELFRRSYSILDPTFWRQAAEALVGDIQLVVNLVLNWWRFTVWEASATRIAGAALSLIVVAIAAALGLRRWHRWVGLAHPATRLGKATRSLWTLCRTAAFAPILMLVVVQVFAVFGLLSPQISEIAYGLVVAVAFGAFGHGVATGLLASAEPERRIVAMEDRTARILSDHLVVAVWLVALFVFLDVVQKAVYSPPILIALASMLSALAIAGVTLHLLLRLRAIAAVGEGQRVPARLWLRGLAWLLTAAVVIALFAGYTRLAEFLAERTVATIVIAGAFYLLVVASDALFTDAFTAETPRGRAVAASLGLHPRRMALIGALLSGIVRVLLLLFAVFLIMGPWEGTATDLVGAVQAFSFGFTIGEVTISYKAILMAAAVLVIGTLLTRAVQRWLETQVLPRTDLEPSLQLSVGMISGYVGIIAAVSLALAALGIDLQKIALVAGALSVGIGFGLQSIVSNFVSGLILLTERPIRVGDWIVAKGEEGFVRRIRVRATEVETFERASVIIPNSDLISGVVKNWTHGNILGRISVNVGVSYDSDAEQVRDLLLAVAAEHPLVLKEPAPYVLFSDFGDSSLNFELRCIVRDIQQSFFVRSDLNFAVLASLRRAGIEIPFPQRVLHFSGGQSPPVQREE